MIANFIVILISEFNKSDRTLNIESQNNKFRISTKRVGRERGNKHVFKPYCVTKYHSSILCRHTDFKQKPAKALLFEKKCLNTLYLTMETTHHLRAYQEDI